MDEIGRDILKRSDRDTLKQRELQRYNGPDRVVSSQEYWELIKNRPPLPSYRTGLAKLDAAIGGFEPGELIVISGPTAMGKTTLCETILKNLSAAGQTALFFTFEVTPEKIVERHRRPGETLYLPLEHKARDLEWLRDRVLETKLKYPYGFAAVFIDHLHYIVDLASRGNVSLEIGQTMRFLKRDVALELKVPVFIVCHIAKVPFGEKLSMNHLRDSSFVSQEADTVLLVCRKNDRGFDGKPLPMISLEQNLAVVSVEKARRTGVMGREIEMFKDGDGLKEVV